MQDLIGYDEIIENSMRSVIYQTLKKIEKKGLPGNHYFVITFATKFPEVSLPKFLVEQYPEEMTIAIQHQFKSLIVEHDFFKISLSFGGNFEKLTIPYKSITSFTDPSISFALKFSISSDLENISENKNLKKNILKSKTSKTKNAVDLSAKVVSLDDFRKSLKPTNQT